MCKLRLWAAGKKNNVVTVYHILLLSLSLCIVPYSYISYLQQAHSITFTFIRVVLKYQVKLFPIAFYFSGVFWRKK